MKVLLTEPINPAGIEILNQVAEVIENGGKEASSIIEKGKEADGVLIRSAKITDEIMAAMPNLKVIGKHGIGVDNIDVEAATRRGIMVVNAPESNVNAVAEHSLCMILALSKHLLQMDKEVRNNNFAMRTQVENIELSGKKLGLLGFGRIARLLAKKCKALDMEILAYDPFITKEQAKDAGVEKVETLEEILEISDFISLHLPLTKETQNLIGKNQLLKMKKSAFIINAARGGIINEADLYEALTQNIIKGAALDVFNDEPPKADSPLFTLPNVLLSPHNAALTDNALVAMATQSAQGICEVLSGKKPTYLVNPQVNDIKKIKKG